MSGWIRVQDRHYKVWPEGLPYSLEPLTGSVFDNLRKTAAGSPETPAVIYYDRVITYRELLDQVFKLAGFLAQKAGVRKNDRVLLYVQNSPQLIIGYYAILAANAVIVPVNPMSRVSELEHIASDADARVAIFGSENTQTIQPLIDAGRLRMAVSTRYADYAASAATSDLPEIVSNAPPEPVGVPSVIPWRRFYSAASATRSARPPPAR